MLVLFLRSGVKDMIPFNPTNPAVYPLVQRVYEFLDEHFPDKYMHLGGEYVCVCFVLCLFASVSECVFFALCLLRM